MSFLQEYLEKIFEEELLDDALPMGINVKKQVPVQYDFFVRNHTYGLKIF